MRVIVRYRKKDGGYCEVHSALVEKAWIIDVLYGKATAIVPSCEVRPVVQGLFKISRSDPHLIHDKERQSYEASFLLGVLLDPFVDLLQRYYDRYIIDRTVFDMLFETKVEKAMEKLLLSRVVRLESQAVKNDKNALRNIRQIADALCWAIRERDQNFSR